MKSFYNDLVLDISENVYEPREDSFLLADNLKVSVGGEVLELGTGSGLQAILAAKQGAKVVATDINPEAIECARKNAEENGVEIEFLVGDLFEPNEKKFDLIIFNPPYLQKDGPVKKPIDLSYNSSEVIPRFLEEYEKYLKPGGRAVIVNSSISGVEVPGKVLAKKKLFFEEIEVVELERTQRKESEQANN